MQSMEFLELYAEPGRETAARQAQQDHASTPDGVPATWSVRDLILWLSMAGACFLVWAILVVVGDHP